MINHETELKLQAYLDGELPAGEAKAIADLLGRDAGAKALYQELRIAKSFLVENELERALPESREFYWSKIQRQIERVESTQADGLTEPAASRWWPWCSMTEPSATCGAIRRSGSAIALSPAI